MRQSEVDRCAANGVRKGDEKKALNLVDCWGDCMVLRVAVEASLSLAVAAEGGYDRRHGDARDEEDPEDLEGAVVARPHSSDAVAQLGHKGGLDKEVAMIVHENREVREQVMQEAARCVVVVVAAAAAAVVCGDIQRVARTAAGDGSLSLDTKGAYLVCCGSLGLLPSLSAH